MIGRPDALDRMCQVLVALVAAFALFNGGFMLVDPFGWYQAVGTVRFTGPPNQHFIRDIGLAYMASGVVLGFAAVRLSMRWLAAAAGNLWLTVHGLLHIWEVLTGVCAPDIFWRDAPGVLGPPLFVWLAIGVHVARQRISPVGLPDALFVNAVERLSPGQAEYLRAVAQAPGGALEKFKHFMPATMHRHAAPAGLFHMARIGATLVEDCGPCALIAAEGALADGVDRDLVNAALRGDPPEGELKSAFVFGAAIAQQLPEAASIGEEIETLYDRSVRTELAMTAATVRAYPALKRGLGLGQACALTHLEV